MRAFLRKILAMAFLAFPAVCSAAPPINDTCAGALVISNSFPYLTPLVDVKDATTNGDPVIPPIGPCRSSAVSRSIWYVFTPTASALYTISTCNDTATTLADTVMAIYTASGTCAGFSLEDCDDDSGCDTRTAIETQLDAGVTYYILVWNSGNFVNPGATLVQLRVSPPPVVPNDLCAGALQIPASGPFPYLTPPSDTRLAGKVGDPPAPLCVTPVPLDRSVWFRFTPAASDTYNFSLCTDTGTSIYDTFLAIYSAASCSGPFTRIACNDDACELQSALTTNLVAGTTYYIVVWDPEHTTGESLIQLRVATAAPRITSGARLPNGSFELRFAANLTQQYTVQGANDLPATWNSLGTLTQSNGVAVFVDTNAMILPRRFYRIRTP